MNTTRELPESPFWNLQNEPFFTADQMRQYAADCVRDALAIEGEAVALCRLITPLGWKLNWMDGDMPPEDVAKLRAAGWQVEYAYTRTTPAVGVDEAMVARFCRKFYELNGYPVSMPRDRLLVCLSAALEAKP